jgi:hypothetical protein
VSDYETAVRIWGVRKLVEVGQHSYYGIASGMYAPPPMPETVDDFDPATITVEYDDDGSSGSDVTGGWSDLGVRIEGTTKAGQRYAVHVNEPFTDVVQEIADVAREAGQ